jgi:formylglycine-generating enzyme required for sulfatase activity
MQRGLELLAHGKGGEELRRNPEPPHAETNPYQLDRLVTAASEREIEAGLRILKDAETLYPDDPMVVKESDPRRAWPHVTVHLSQRSLRDAAAAGADLSELHAFLRAIDPITETIGPKVELGPLPIDDRAIEPGVYRIVVEIPGFGFSEHLRVLALRPEPFAIDAFVRRTEDVVRDMHRIEGGTFRYRHEGVYAKLRCGIGCSEVHTAVDLDPYWIAPALASNREVLAFLRETKHVAPSLWYALGYENEGLEFVPPEKLDDWYELPAVGFDWTFARDYAEWAGMRLPEHAELERALRGSSALYFPWGDELPVPPTMHVNIGTGMQSSGAFPAERFALYLEHARPVRDPECLHPPEDLFHAFGNVRQWTESLLVEVHGGLVEAMPHERLLLGSAWWQDLENTTLAAHATRSADERYPALDVGIRCAKSATP